MQYQKALSTHLHIVSYEEDEQPSKRLDLGEKVREGIDESYQGIKFVDERIARVPERGGEIDGGQAQRDGGGEHGPER